MEEKGREIEESEIYSEVVVSNLKQLFVKIAYSKTIIFAPPPPTRFHYPPLRLTNPPKYRTNDKTKRINEKTNKLTSYLLQPNNNIISTNIKTNDRFFKNLQRL